MDVFWYSPGGPDHAEPQSALITTPLYAGYDESLLPLLFAKFPGYFSYLHFIWSAAFSCLMKYMF